MFGSYAFIEGWAHYCEQMVIGHGYGGADNPHLQVAQLGEALLRNCRYNDRVDCRGIIAEFDVNTFTARHRKAK